MEETGNNTVVFKQRSIYRCFRDGAAFVMKNFNAMCRHLWPFALVYMVLIVALFGYQRAVVADILSGNIWPKQAYAMLLSLVTEIAALLFFTSLVLQQRSLAATGTLPREKIRKVWRELLRDFWRVVKVAVIFCVVACIIFIIGLFLCVMPASASAPDLAADVEVVVPSTGYWLTAVVGWVVIVCLSLLLLGVAYHVCFEYLVGGTSLKVAFGSLRWSRRYLGRNMLMAFVSLVVAAVVEAFFSIPSVTCSYIDTVSIEMMLNEEVADLPSYYPYISMIAWLLTALGCCLATLFVSFQLLLNWGAVRATESQRMEQDTKL